MRVLELAILELGLRTVAVDKLELAFGFGVLVTRPLGVVPDFVSLAVAIVLVAEHFVDRLEGVSSSSRLAGGLGLALVLRAEQRGFMLAGALELLLELQRVL